MFSKTSPEAPASSEGKSSSSLGLLLVGEKKKKEVTDHTNRQIKEKNNLLSSHDSKFNEVKIKENYFLALFKDRLWNIDYGTSLSNYHLKKKKK